MTRRARLIFVALALTGTAAAGCDRLPPVPTLIPTSTPEASATAAPQTATPTITPTASATPTRTPIPAPTVTLPPSDTPRPPTATYDPAALNTPVAQAVADGMEITLSAAQINAAIAAAFDAAPLPGYALAPRIDLGTGALTLRVQIVPRGAAAGTPAMPLALDVALGIVGGQIETQPTRLTPLESAVKTQQVKLAEALLRRTLDNLTHVAAGGGPMYYNSARIAPAGITFKVVRVT